mmetsp:Transcript_30296/g.58235  ORF Transcript_30296/g.58235 Transcript_30296/m.58235 type:complete len:271 (-) Transcript_30296:131-943(-)
MHPYATQEYWDQRYAERREEDGNCKTFEWYLRWDKLAPIMHKLLQPADRILHVGSGSSTLSEHMYTAGYTNAVNIDCSKTIIEAMRRRCADMTEMTWEVDDCRATAFEDNSFDVAIDKGTLDALSCGDTEGTYNTCSEMHRILKPGGRFISISSSPMFVYLSGKLGCQVKWEDIKVEKVTGDGGLSWYNVHECIVPNPKPKLKRSILDSWWGPMAPSCASSASAQSPHYLDVSVRNNPCAVNGDETASVRVSSSCTNQDHGWDVDLHELD